MFSFTPRPLKEQIVVITGASSGIGRRTAQLLAEKKVAGVALAARNELALAETAREVEAHGVPALVIPTDVGDRAQVDRLAALTVARFGRIDTWVNNAGVSSYALVQDQPVEDMERIVQTNLFGVIHGVKAALPFLTQQGGTIINVASTLGERAIPLQTIYCATKHAVKGFTEGLRMELAYEKVPVNVTLILPAVMDTPFYTNAKSLMGRRPKAVPPMYDATVTAEAIVFACEHPRRDIYTGGTAKALAVMEHIAPGLMDEFMVGTGMFTEGQLSNDPDDGRENLYHPAPGTGSVAGPGNKAKSGPAFPSPYTRLIEEHPAARTLLTAAAVGGLAALLWNRGRAA